jgi:plasmid stabilization system protein ParE
MTYGVIITRRAERDMRDSAQWWSVERSAEQANRWLDGLYEHLQSLANSPMRCPLAPEHEQFPYELRELHNGLGRRPTHRAIFTMAEDLVLVLSIRHAAQDRLRPEDNV